MLKLLLKNKYKGRQLLCYDIFVNSLLVFQKQNPARLNPFSSKKLKINLTLNRKTPLTIKTQDFFPSSTF